MLDSWVWDMYGAIMCPVGSWKMGRCSGKDWAVNMYFGFSRIYIHGNWNMRECALTKRQDVAQEEWRAGMWSTWGHRHLMAGQWKKDGERKKTMQEWSENKEPLEEPMVTKVYTLTFSPCVQVLQPVHSRLWAEDFCFWGLDTSVYAHNPVLISFSPLDRNGLLSLASSYHIYSNSHPNPSPSQEL